MVPELLMLLPALFKGGMGLYDLVQSNKYAKTPRPDYEIPQASTQALNSAAKQALQTQLPGQGLMEEKMGATTAAGIGASREATDSPANLLGMIAKLSGQQTEGMQNMAGAAAENYNTNQGILRTQLGDMATQQSNQWTWDKAQPYQNDMSVAGDLQKAGEYNINTGLTDATNAMMMKYYLDSEKTKKITDTTTPTTTDGENNQLNILDILENLNKKISWGTDMGLNPNTKKVGWGMDSDPGNFGVNNPWQKTLLNLYGSK